MASIHFINIKELARMFFHGNYFTSRAAPASNNDSSGRKSNITRTSPKTKRQTLIKKKKCHKFKTENYNIIEISSFQT